MLSFAAFNKLCAKYFAENPARSCKLPKEALVEVVAEI